MASAKDIRFDQRNVTNTAYQEKYVNGNSLIIRTDSTGSVVGASTLEGVAIGIITPSTANFTNVTASVISASVFIGNLSGSLSGSSIITNNLTATNSNLINITSSNISASGYISASAANFNTLNSNSSRLFNITSSNISASGQIIAAGFSGSVFGTSSWSNNSSTASYFGSGSNNYFPFWTSNKLSFDSLISQGNNEISILSDTASFLGNTLVVNKSDPFYTNNNPTIDVSNSPNQTLMLTPNVMLGGNGNAENWNRFNSDGTVDFLGANIKFTSGGAAAFNSSVTIGSSTLLGNNTLDVIGNISAFAITASNISASGNTELNTLSVRGNTTLYGNFTVYGTGSVVNISSSTVIIGDNRIQLNAWSTGSLSQRYAGLDLTDSGSNNNVTSSL
jgi:hypothetical protein